jgi:uncharacterized protein
MVIPMNKQKKYPHLGFGLGLRKPHYQEILTQKPKIDWFEVISENFMMEGGRPKQILQQIRDLYPIVLHGVSLSIGSTDPLNMNYLKQLKTLALEFKPAWISDHLCWTGVNGIQVHDLLPLPYTEESLKHVVERITQVQDYLEQRIVIENVSSYINYKINEFTEWDFLAAVSEQADCLILLDINNVYVNAFNHHFDAKEYLNAIPSERVQQFHLAGHENMETHIIDTHDHPIIADVWELYEYAISRFGSISTLIERDENIPALDELLAELQMAKKISHAKKKEYDYA